jgi:rhamnosyltransferase
MNRPDKSIATNAVKCVVLLAAYNGKKWIKEQIKSIQNQCDVNVKIVVSDDNSTDGTFKMLNKLCKKNYLILLNQKELRLGSASKNFSRLIIDINVEDYEYFALSDQDDVWNNDKLKRAICLLSKTGADCYSSNVKAIWANGRCINIYKSQPQTEIDFLFSSPGPGCTFVLRRAAFLKIKEMYQKHQSQINRIDSHDWLIYAFARSIGLKWIIDEYISMQYRQHNSNEFGANSGLNGAVKRIRTILTGKYRDQVIKIGSVSNVSHPVMDRIVRFNLLDRIWILAHSVKMRRRLVDSVFLGFALCFSRRHSSLTNK